MWSKTSKNVVFESYVFQRFSTFSTFFDVFRCFCTFCQNSPPPNFASFPQTLFFTFFDVFRRFGELRFSTFFDVLGSYVFFYHHYIHHAPIVTSTTLYSQRNLSSTLYSQRNLKRTLCIQRNIKRTLSIQRNHNYTLCTVRVFLNLVRSPATPRRCAPGGSGLSYIRTFQ